MARRRASTSETWDQWIRTISKNKNFKVLVGVPASKNAAGWGYIDGDQLRAVVKYIQKFKSLEVVMIWDSFSTSSLGRCDPFYYYYNYNLLS